MTRRLLTATAIGLALAAGLPGTAGAAEPRASLPDVEDEVMCPICGTLLAESQSPQADRERALIRKLIAEGKDKEQIKDTLVTEYGPRVLATPSGHGFDLVAWLVPGLAIALGVCGIGFFALRRLSRSSISEAPPVDPADASRLDEDMSRYPF
jgi:cytochrome c-type biogenesis protein CcmH